MASKQDTTQDQNPMNSAYDSTRRRRGIARRIASALDHAIEHKMFELGDRLAQTAIRLAADNPQLFERIARLRICQDEPETALRILETSPRHTSSMRLLRACCLLQLGRKAEARLDLMQWSRETSAPLAARLLLAHLVWDDGETQLAAVTLHRNLQQLDDPHSLQLMLLLAIQRHQPETVTILHQQLTDQYIAGHVPDSIRLFEHSLSLQPLHNARRSDLEQVKALALELIAHEPVIPSLVAAQMLQPQRTVARLLVDAVQTALPNLVDSESAFAALARLHLVLKQPNQAMTWIDRGMHMNPMSAVLALLHHEIESVEVTATESQETTPTDGVLAKISPTRRGSSSHAARIRGKAA